MIRNSRRARWLRLLLGTLLVLISTTPSRAQSPSNSLLLRDIAPGPRSADPQQLTVVGDQAFFTATTPATGRELWITDGTPAGTRIVTDLTPGPADTPFGQLVALPDRLLFQRIGLDPPTLWQSDGTPAGTRLLQTVDGPFAGALVVRGTDAFVFTHVGAGTADDHYQLWRSGGTPATTLPVSGATMRTSGSLGPWPDLFVSGDHLYSTVRFWNGHFGGLNYAAFDGTQFSHVVGCSPNGWTFACTRPTGWRGELVLATGAPRQLLLMQGSLTRTVDFSALPLTTIGALVNVNDTLIFAAWGGTSGTSLWRSDGTLAGTQRMTSVATALTDLWVGHGRAYFFQPGADGTNQLWQTDGTASGTVQATGPGGQWGASLHMQRRLAVGNRLLLAVDDGIHGVELWEVATPDGVPTMVADVAPGAASSDPAAVSATGEPGLVLLRDGLLWTATDPVAGRELRYLAAGFAPYVRPAWGGGPAAGRATVPLVLGNRGQRSVPLTLTLTLPAGTQLIDHTLGVTPTVAGATIQWRLGGLPTGEQQVLLGVQLPEAPLGTVLTATVQLNAGPMVPITLAVAHQHYLPSMGQAGLNSP